MVYQVHQQVRNRNAMNMEDITIALYILSVHNLNEHMGSAFSQTQHIKNGYQLLKEIRILFHEYDASFNHLRGTQFTSLNCPNAQCLNRARMIYVAYSLEITVYQYKNMGGLLYTSQKLSAHLFFFYGPRVSTDRKAPWVEKFPRLSNLNLYRLHFWATVIGLMSLILSPVSFMKESVLF